MTLVSSFGELIQQLAFVMTAPIFDTFVTILTGWVFARRHTVTGAILAADAVGTKHHSAFHRLFAKAAPEATDRMAAARRRSRFFGFPGVPGFQRQPWGAGWALVGDASHFKDPLSAHGITDALRDAEFLARAISSHLAGETPEECAFETYRRTRDRLSEKLFTAI